MTEADLKADLVRAFNRLPGVCAFRVEVNSPTGIPDLVANRVGASAWIEVKYHRPGQRKKYRASKRQLLMLARLHGYLATFVQEKNGTKRIDLEEYGGNVVFTSSVHAEHGWPKAIEHLAREIALSRLGL